MDLGHHPPSDAFLSNLDGPETYYPLTVHVCTKCDLVQLGYTVPPDVLFTNKYPYLTGSNAGGVEHFHRLATDTVKRFKLKPFDMVVDVGSNDGTLLSGFQNEGVRVFGVEPCENVAAVAMRNGVPTVNTWFGKDMAVKNAILDAKVITACNVFAHVPDINGFVDTVKTFLAEDGVFIIESPYLLDMIDNLAYDTIYHEHIYYWAYSPLQRLLGKHDLEVFDIEKKDVHGGTIRYYIGHRGAHDRVRYRVTSVFEQEKKVNIDYLIDFAEKVKQHKKDLNDLLKRIKQKGKKIFGLSAPAKGNTLLNYCHINGDVLEYITEINPLKVGKYTPGVHVPVIHENAAGGCSYALLLAWNWKDQIIGNMGEFIRGGGRFIIPIPEPKIEHIGSGVWAGYEL
uniref:Putative methyltransferase n=1 Tax=viral metagenome TaxID=1070528 RepID=A0A6H1ZFL6_9ZZZZ